MKTARKLLLPVMLAAGSLMATSGMSDSKEEQGLKYIFGLGDSYCAVMSSEELVRYLDVVENDIANAKTKNVSSVFNSSPIITYIRDQKCEPCQKMASFLNAKKQENEIVMDYFNAGELTGSEVEELLKEENNKKKYDLIVALKVEKQLKK